MRAKHTVVAAGLLALLSTACASMKVSSTAAPGAAQRAASFRTYAWLPEPDAEQVHRNPFVKGQVMQAADRELTAKGYQRVDASANPDFMIGWYATSQEKQQVEDHYYAGHGYGWGPYGGAYGPPQVTSYTEGSLVLDIVEPGRKEILWRGQAQANLGENPTGEDARKKIDEAAHKLLAQFPPKL
ncbi:MAG TPA: DUF4136 domain-containing protein [Myxococcales bacterium]|jgi:hypothetical protein